MKRIKKVLLLLDTIIIVILLGILFNYLLRDKEEVDKSIYSFPSSFNCLNKDTNKKCIIKNNNIEVILYIKDVYTTLGNDILLDLSININNYNIKELNVTKYSNQLEGMYIYNDLFVIGFKEGSSECNINLYVYDALGNRLDYNTGEYNICKINDNSIELKDLNSCNNIDISDKIIKKNVILNYKDSIIEEEITSSSNSCY